MEEITVFNADSKEIYELIAIWYDDSLWFEDIDVYQNGYDVIIESPIQATDSILNVLYNDAYNYKVL